MSSVSWSGTAIVSAPGFPQQQTAVKHGNVYIDLGPWLLVSQHGTASHNCLSLQFARSSPKRRLASTCSTHLGRHARLGYCLHSISRDELVSTILDTRSPVVPSRLRSYRRYGDCQHDSSLSSEYPPSHVIGAIVCREAWCHFVQRTLIPLTPIHTATSQTSFLSPQAQGEMKNQRLKMLRLIYPGALQQPCTTHRLPAATQPLRLRDVHYTLFSLRLRSVSVL